MRNFLLSTLLLAASHLGAQDTLRVMSYNVLNYSSGNAPERSDDLREIVQYVNPDIVICQEMVNSAGAQLLLDDAFNAGGGTTWARATFINGPDSDNTLYYKTAKIKFKEQHQISTDLRDITHYRVYTLIAAGDTAWLDLFSLHLKASEGFETERLNECKDLCNYFGGLSAASNIVVGGDFNFYSQSTETGFNWLTSTNCDQRLYDPINRIGEWNNNSTFKDVHTQSTRVNTEPDGGSTGGLDDRFDWLFTNNNVMAGLSKVRYVPGTYTAVGQDQNHFNKAINASPTNTAVPVAIANALYNMSDHLPLYFDLAIGNEVGISEFQSNLPGTHVKWIFSSFSPTTDFLLETKENGTMTVNVYDIFGKLVHSKNVQVTEGSNKLSLELNAVSQGQYLLRLETVNGWVGCKFVK